jgi:hypothetical protein
VLDPGEYLILFASGQLTDNYIDAAGYLHTNFAISADEWCVRCAQHCSPTSLDVIRI